MTDNAFERRNPLHLFAHADILLLRMILDALQTFQPTDHKIQLMADIGADAFTLRIIDALQHELQHLLIGRP